MHAASLVRLARGSGAALWFAGVTTVAPTRAALQAGPSYVEKHRMLPILPWSIGELLPIDADGDGDVDLVGTGWAGTSVLLRNDGNGGFALDRSALPTGATLIPGGASGDVDGDGDNDLVLAIGAASTPLAALYLNDGAGRFADASAQLPVAMGDAVDVALADFDGDGDLDVVLALYARFLLYRNDGGGGFSELADAFPLAGTLVGRIAVGDVDGDSDVDVLVPDDGPGTTGLRLYRNAGGGSFTSEPIAVPGTDGVAVELVDFDGDFDLDAVYLEDQATRILRNDGAGGFLDLGGLGHFPQNAHGLAIGDVNGDSWPDIALAMQGANRLYINVNGTGNLADGSALLPEANGHSGGVTLADVDGDADADLLVAGVTRPYASLYLNDPNVALRDVGSGDPIDEPTISAVALGDLDGDGDVDAVIGNRLYYPNRIYRNDGTGRLEPAPYAMLPGPTTGTAALALGDVDVDGDLDLLIGNDAGDEMPLGSERLFLNQGDGSFVDESARLGPAFDDRTFTVLFADVERDGDLDILVLNYAWGPSRLLRNDGSGHFSAVPGAVPAVSDVVAGAVGDVDGDQDLDLLVGFAHGQDQLWRNDGSGIFQPDPSALPALTFWTSGVALGDVDADGDLDAVLGARTATTPYAERNRLLLNDGSGHFTESPDGLPATVDATFAVLLADLDLDGDLDLLVGNAAYQAGDPYQDVRLRNDGNGRFTPDDSLVDLPATSTEFAVADLDLDGDADVVRVQYDPRRAVLFSATRHLAWRGLPRVGKPLEFVLNGPPGERYLLLGARAAGTTPHACGTWSIDRATVFFRDTGTFDALGRAQVSYLVPEDPALVGVELFWQAIVGPPCAFTGAERTLLTAY